MSSPLSNIPEEEAGPSGASATLNEGNTSSAGSANQQGTQTSHVFVTMDDILAIENEVAVTSGSDSDSDSDPDSEDEQDNEEQGEDGADGAEQVEEPTPQAPASPTAHLHPNPTFLSFPKPPLPDIGETGRGLAESSDCVVYDVLGEVSDHMRYPLVVEVVPHEGDESSFTFVVEDDLLTSEEYWGPFDEDSGLETESNSGDDNTARVRFPVPHLGQEYVWGWWARADGRLFKGYGRVVNIWLNVVKVLVFEYALHLMTAEEVRRLSGIAEVPEEQQLDTQEEDDQ